ncbi:MAG: R3H domain-containing nucleic acid-binding protein, partial [Smithellaceae bacterium]|nr:R3H domain-containing nucleic acid-binding protein [Smithellaceae bacterium]
IIRSENGKKGILVDFENYRKRQEESLIALAHNLGERVKKNRKPVTVDPMDAHSRRIIHMALRDDESLTTISRGEGKNRKIVIMPAKKQRTMINEQ